MCIFGKARNHDSVRDTPFAWSHNLCMAKKVDAIALEMGKRITADRKSKGWTQYQLALKTGWDAELDDGAQRNVLSPSRIGNFEQGTRRVRHEQAQILGRIFGRPTAYYLAAVTEQEAAVIDAMRDNAA